MSLAARYRPQTFAETAGQDMVKTVLSRAAAEDTPAAAYLLSGTRGVGKTTLARIFAKALNCERAPGPEPCNECAQCRKITQGAHVDVTEIDGASNNSVEDARALRENIGYAPMEGRYKVFIIDEAHMLTRNAFNALLKTLEEPPARVVFIFATTEAHKFPITIVSRCQHFVFRHLSEDALVAHLTMILAREHTPFEEGAVRLIARRAAGSVRDGMSLLDQTLALAGALEGSATEPGAETAHASTAKAGLTSAVTREVLGLAGQELFSRLFEALIDRNCAAVADITRQLLQQGVDIGFFVRELASFLRDLFLLRHGGPAILPSLALPDDEAALRQSLAPRFSAAHLHAAWQMTLDGQRGIVQSPEPGAALELLLLNLALLPQLLPLENVPTAAQSAPAAPATPGAHNAPAAPTAPAAPATPATPTTPTAPTAPTAPATPTAPNTNGASQSLPQTPATSQANGQASRQANGQANEQANGQAEKKCTAQPKKQSTAQADTQIDTRGDTPAVEQADTPAVEQADTPAGRHVDSQAGVQAASPTVQAPQTSQASPTAQAGAQPSWQAICEFFAVEQAAGRANLPQHILRQVRAHWQNGQLHMAPGSETVLHQLERQRTALGEALGLLGAGEPEIIIASPRPPRRPDELAKEFAERPELQACLEVLDASIDHCVEIT